MKNESGKRVATQSHRTRWELFYIYSFDKFGRLFTFASAILPQYPKYMNRIFALVFFLFSVNIYAQTMLPETIRPDSLSMISFCQKNDSTITMNLVINHHTHTEEYQIIDGIPFDEYVPRFLERYQNSLIFINGKGQHYRLLTVFTLVGERIVKDLYENELEINRNRVDESYLFFYQGSPIKIVTSTDGKVKFKQLNPKHKTNLASDEINYISCSNKGFDLVLTNGETLKVK